MPASGSPSELSAHQMGLSLAGTSRSKKATIDSTGILDVGDTVQLTIADRALMRKYGLSNQPEETVPEPGIHDGTIPAIQGVDGHPPRRHLSLYDRMLLRKYSATELFVIVFLSSGVSNRKHEEEEKVLQKGKSGQRSEERSWSSTGGLSLRISVPGCRATCSSGQVDSSSSFEFWTFLLHALHAIVSHAGSRWSFTTGLSTGVCISGTTCTPVGKQVAGFGGCSHRFRCIHDS